MVAFFVFLASLVLLGAAGALKLRQRQSAPVAPASVSTPVDGGQDLLPDGGAGNGLAAFYAYQMAAGRIDRPR